ncbi:hypothetical protein ATANTOWER_013200, partial [Ataeniobius toweri]|nr:hypothetical protein [Ataeniobius toweri]
ADLNMNSLHPDLTSQTWKRLSRAAVDLLATWANVQRLLWFSLSPPLGVDAFPHSLCPKMLLHAFPPVPLIQRHNTGPPMDSQVLVTEHSLATH